MSDAVQESCLLPTLSAAPSRSAYGEAEPSKGNPRGRSKHRWELFWRYWLPVLAMLTLIKLESTDTMSGAHTHGFLARWLLWIGVHLHGATLDLVNLVMRKSGHMLGYGLLCLSWLFLLRGSYWLRHEYQLSFTGSIQVRRLWWRLEWGALAVLLTFAVACADEFHQMSIPSRDGCWSDVGIDTTAALVAAAIIWARAYLRCSPTPAIEAGR
jgi:VanZ family protein